MLPQTHPYRESWESPTRILPQKAEWLLKAARPFRKSKVLSYVYHILAIKKELSSTSMSIGNKAAGSNINSHITVF